MRVYIVYVCIRSIIILYANYGRPPPPPTYNNNNNAGGPSSEPFARQEDRCRSSDSSWWCSRPDPRHRHAADAVFPYLFTRFVRSSPVHCRANRRWPCSPLFFFFSFNDRFIRTLIFYIFLNITLETRD